jgi:hypothetical protein
MPTPDEHSAATAGTSMPKALAGLAGLACLACCLIPVLLTAGVLGGAGWIALGQWMPVLALALAATVAGRFWVTARRRRRPARCRTGCTCGQHVSATA